MATRFLVAIGTWDASNTAIWSASSGGASGASAPTSADDVVIDSLSPNGTFTIAAGAACNNFTVTWTAVKTNILSLSANFAPAGLMTLTGNSATNRIFMQSGTLGTPRTVTLGTAPSLTNVGFMDITAAGAGGTWSGTSIGDAGGNSNITPTPSATQTATGAAGFTWSTHGWSGAPGRVPLPQDDVVISNAFVGGQTITMDMPRIGRSVTFSCTGNPTYNQTVASSIFGNMEYAAGMTTSGSQNLFFGFRGTATLKTNGVSVTQSIRSGGGVAGFNTTIMLLDALTATAGITAGANTSFNDGGFSVTAPSITVSAASSGITLGGPMALTGSGTPFSNSAGGTVTLNGSSSQIRLTDASASAKLFAGGGKTYNNIWFNNAGTGTFDLSGSNTFNQIKVDAGRSVRFTAGTTTTVPPAGWQFGSGCTIGSITAAGHTLAASGGAPSDYVYAVGASISRSAATPANKFFASAASTDGGNNSGWTFMDVTPALSHGAATGGATLFGDSKSKEVAVAAALLGNVVTPAALSGRVS